MEETIKQLRPIERLYFISQEREEVYTKKTKTFCLLYSLINNQSLKVSSNNKRLIVHWNTTDFPNKYELEILNLINDNKYLELNNLIDNKLIFKKTLIDVELYKEEVSIKKVFFLKLANTNLVKTPMYYKLTSHYLEKLDNNIPVLNLVCDRPDLFNKTKTCYSILKNCVEATARKAEQDKIKPKEKEKKKE